MGGIGDAFRSPWWYWLGGGMGVLVVFSITVCAPRIGATAIGALIAGQLAMGVLIDRFGLFGVEQVAPPGPGSSACCLFAVGAALALYRR